MSNAKKILIVIVAAFTLMACKTATNIPKQYNFTATEISSNPFGSWTTLTGNFTGNNITNDTISGELICIDSDTVYILEHDHQIKRIPSQTVADVKLYTHKNMASAYANRTSLFLIPAILGALVHLTEYAGGFLILGVPIALVGYTQAIIENGARRNILVYPQKNTLEELKLFARFPGGKPFNIDFGSLTLKK